jgi:hypothetical protein
LCWTPDEAAAESEHADGQQHCAGIGEIDEPVVTSIAAMGIEPRTIHFMILERLASST